MPDEKISKHDLAFRKTFGDGRYEEFDIVGLGNCFSSVEKAKNGLPYAGVAALLANPAYEGYCVLCRTHSTAYSDQFEKPGYTVEFAPLYDRMGNVILVKHQGDALFVSVDRSCLPSRKDATISFMKNGSFTEFTPWVEEDA